MTAMEDDRGNVYIHHDDEPDFVLEPDSVIWEDMHEAIAGPQGDDN